MPDNEHKDQREEGLTLSGRKNGIADFKTISSVLLHAEMQDAGDNWI